MDQVNDDGDLDSSGRAKWVMASLAEDAATVIAKVFDPAQRRDPKHARRWVADRMRAEAQTPAALAASVWPWWPGRRRVCGLRREVGDGADLGQTFAVAFLPLREPHASLLVAVAAAFAVAGVVRRVA